MKTRSLLASLACLCANSLAAADLPMGHADFMPSPERPVGWRGDGSGRYPGTNPVTTWDIDKGENLIWKLPTVGFACSGPIVVGNKVFTTAEPDLLICVDAATDKELWRRHNALFMEALPEEVRAEAYATCDELLQAGREWCAQPIPADAHGDLANGMALFVKNYDKRMPANFEETIAQEAATRGVDLAGLRAAFEKVGSSGEGKQVPTLIPQPLIGGRDYFWVGNTAPTPASDGQRVIIKIGSKAQKWGHLIAYDLNGTRLWTQEIGRTGTWTSPYDSPLIIDGKVISQHEVALDPWKSKKMLSAFDITNGRLLWSQGAGLDCASPIGLQLDGVPLVFYAGRVFLAADGRVVCTMENLKPDVSTACIDGDHILHPNHGRNAQPIINRMHWKEKGTTLAYEEVFRGVTGDGGGTLPYGWNRGSPLLCDGWIFKSKKSARLLPELFKINTRIPFEPGNTSQYTLTIDAKDAVRTRGKGHPTYGPPDEDSMSIAMAGRHLFLCPSTWPSQFMVASVPPDVQVVATPVASAPVIGSPFFQGNRMYLRDYRHLFCIGDPRRPYHAPKGGKQ